MSTDPRWLPPVPAYDPPQATEPAAPPPPPREQPAWRRYLGPIGLGLFALLKWGKALLLLLPKVKILSTSATALVSVAAYALFWGWKFAAILVALLFVHEMGHVLQLRREGIKASAPMFIPFLGAVVAMKELPDDAAAEARVGLAGPILGSIGAAALLPIHWATGSDLWLNLAYVGFFLNLFNLLPVTPLDGGRAMAALAPWMWFVGLFALAVLAFTFPNPIIILILLVGGFDVYRRWKHRKAEGQVEYYKVRKRTRAAIGATYLLLIVGLVLGMDATFQEREL